MRIAVLGPLMVGGDGGALGRRGRVVLEALAIGRSLMGHVRRVVAWTV